MDEKRDFFESLGKSRKKQVIIFCLSMVVLVSIYLTATRALYERFEIIEDNFSWVYQVDSIEEIDGKLQIKGWAFALGKDATQENCEIILYDTETGKGIYPKMTYESREDVNEYFLCEYDYTESGFEANISTKKLQLENTVYEILLRPEGEKKAFSTNVYYSNDEIMYVHPDEFVPLKVAGTDLEEVVEQGVLRVYKPDCRMYVYQYDGELYWIAELEYGFNESNETYVQWHLGTSQIEKLPKYRLENEWYFDDRGFYFSENELKDWNVEKYRVAKKELPPEYSIIQMSTGRYEQGWIWNEYFRPYYALQ